MYHYALVLASICAVCLSKACYDPVEPAPNIVVECNQGLDTNINCNTGNTDTESDPPDGEGGCSAEEKKCITSDGAPGWCMDKYSEVNPRAGLVCLACDDRYTLVPKLELCPPGCAIPDGVFSKEQCQGPVGSGGCPAACCPICY